MGPDSSREGDKAEVFPRVVVRPPGPKARELLKRDWKLLSSSSLRRYPLIIESGKGCIVKDVDGNHYIDFNSGLLCLNVGHTHRKIVDAVKKQCDRFFHYPGFYYCEVLDLAEKIFEITPGHFDKRVFFSNSGTEAVEAAVKLAKWHTRKHRFIAFMGSFHGETLGSLALTANKLVQRRYFFPFLPGVTHVPYPYCYRCPFKLSYPDCGYWCVDYIDEVILQNYVPPEEVAALVFEPIQVEGCIVPPPEYFQRIKRMADKYGLLLIDDEAQTGVGRTGRWFAIEHWKIEPDVICLAESLSSGLPLGATVARARLMDWESGSHTSRCGGNPLACRAAIALIDVIREENLLENAGRQGSYIMKVLKELMEESTIIGDVRGKGLMIGAEIVEGDVSKKPSSGKAKEVMLRCWKRGVSIVTCGVSTLMIAPPLNITRELVEKGLEVVVDVIKEVEKESGELA